MFVAELSYPATTSRPRPSHPSEATLASRLQAVLLAKQGKTALQRTSPRHSAVPSPPPSRTGSLSTTEGTSRHSTSEPAPRTAPTGPAGVPTNVRQRLDAPPRPGNGACTLRGRRCRQRILEQEFGATMGLQTVSDDCCIESATAA